MDLAHYILGCLLGVALGAIISLICTLMAVRRERDQQRRWGCDQISFKEQLRAEKTALIIQHEALRTSLRELLDDNE